MVSRREKDNIKRNKDLIIFSSIFLIVLMLAASIQLHSIQIGSDIDINTFKLILLYFSNASFIILLYIHFYTYINEFIFNKNISNFRTLHITNGYKGYKLFYHILVCIFLLKYLHAMSGYETIEEVDSILSIANYVLVMHYLLSMSVTSTRNLKGEMQVGLFDLATIVFFEFDAKVYFVSNHVYQEAFFVYRYTISDDKNRIHLYNEKGQSPYITLFFKTKTKKYNDIIMFLNENYLISDEEKREGSHEKE